MDIDYYMNDFLAEMEKNIADEAEARRGYYLLARNFGDLMSDSELRDLEVIISEELKHSELLARMIERRSGIDSEKI